MGSGGIKQSESNLQSTANAQAAQGLQLGAQGQSYLAKGQAEQQPLVNFLQSIIGGNSTTTNQAIAPVIKNITDQTTANRAHIFDTVAPGAGRDVALAQNLQSQGGQIASATNSTFLGAFPQLAALSSGNTNAGLGLTGAGITSTSNGATTTGHILSAQQQQKSSQLSAITGLAGIAGNVATGGLSGAASKLGKAAARGVGGMAQAGFGPKFGQLGGSD